MVEGDGGSEDVWCDTALQDTCGARKNGWFMRLAFLSGL